MGISFSFKWIKRWGCAVPRSNSFTLILLLETSIFSRLSDRVFCIIIAFSVFFFSEGGTCFAVCSRKLWTCANWGRSFDRNEWLYRFKWNQSLVDLPKWDTFAKKLVSRTGIEIQIDGSQKELHVATTTTARFRSLALQERNQWTRHHIHFFLFASSRIWFELDEKEMLETTTPCAQRSAFTENGTANGEKRLLALAQFQKRLVFNPCAFVQRMFHILLVSFFSHSYRNRRHNGMPSTMSLSRIAFRRTHICTACMLGCFNEYAVLPQTNSLELDEWKEKHSKASWATYIAQRAHIQPYLRSSLA